METIAGMHVLTTLEEIVDPSRAAVIVIDVQNDSCSTDGSWAKAGDDLGMMKTVVPSIRLLIDGARAHGVPVIYVRYLAELAYVSPAYLRFLTKKCNLPADRLAPAPGTWGAEIVAEVAPQPGEMVITKHRSSAFVGTDLDLVLRSNGVASVIVCGVATYACVESTIRDAFNNDYYVVEVEDAVGGRHRALHEASLAVMRSRIDVVTCDAVLAAWDGQDHGSSTEATMSAPVSFPGRGSPAVLAASVAAAERPR